jgi:hypothetical protein
MFYCSLTDNNLMPLHRQVVLLDWSEKAPWPSIITQSVCLITSQQFIAYHFDSNFINRIFFFFTLRTSKCIAIVRWNVIENTDSYTVVYNVMLHAVFFFVEVILLSGWGNYLWSVVFVPSNSFSLLFWVS